MTRFFGVLGSLKPSRGCPDGALEHCRAPNMMISLWVGFGLASSWFWNDDVVISRAVNCVFAEFHCLATHALC